MTQDVAWLRRLAGYGLSVAGLATVWLVLKLPGYSLANVAAAMWLCRAYWIAALLFGMVSGAARLWQRLAHGPAPAASAPPPLTGDARRANTGRSIVAWYMVGGFSLLVLFSVAGRGPFAWATASLRPALGVATPFAGFVLGCVTFVLPLLLLGRLPRAPASPMLAAAQDMVRRQPRARPAKHRRARPPRTG